VSLGCESARLYTRLRADYRKSAAGVGLSRSPSPPIRRRRRRRRRGASSSRFGLAAIGPESVFGRLTAARFHGACIIACNSAWGGRLVTMHSGCIVTSLPLIEVLNFGHLLISPGGSGIGRCGRTVIENAARLFVPYTAGRCARRSVERSPLFLALGRPWLVEGRPAHR